MINLRIQEATAVRINKLCKERHITLNKLAYLSALSPGALRHIMNGRTKATTLSTIQKVCDGLDISVADFFSDSLFVDIDPEIQ